MIALIGLSNLEVKIHPIETDYNEYMGQFVENSEQYGGVIVDSYVMFFENVKSISDIFEDIKETIEKITYSPELDTPGGLEDWQNANIFEKFWWSFVDIFK